MAISNSINFTVTSQDIITDALQLLGVLGEGQTSTSAQNTTCLRTLNMLVKFWQADGLNLFAVQPCYLFLNQGQQQYSLSGTTTDQFTASFRTNLTNATQAAGGTTIQVPATTTIAVSDHIGVATSGTVMFWTTVTSVSTVGANTTVGLTAPIPAGTSVATGATVYSYTTTANRPMRILEAYTHRTLDDSDIPVGVISRVDYYSLSKKDSQGQTVQVYFDPQISASNLYVWPVNSSELDYLILICQRTLSDFDNLTDTPDYPQEWYMPLVYNLAMSLAPKYGTPAMDFQRIQFMAKSMYETASGWDAEEETSMYLKPDTWGSQGRTAK